MIWRAYPQLLLGAAKGLAGHDTADPSDFLDRATLRGFAPDLLAEDAGRCTAALGLIADADPALAAPLLFEAASKAGPDRRGLLLRELVTTLGRSSEVHDRRLARQVATWIGEHPELFKLGYFEAQGRWASLHQPDYTFAVNYRQNFDLIEQVFGDCYPQDYDFSLPAVMALLDARPELIELMGPPKSTTVRT